MANLGDVLVWGLRLSCLGLCLYGVLSRKKHFIRFGLSGIGGSMLGWGMTTMILSDPFTGLFGVVFGLALVWFVNPGLLKIWNRRKVRKIYLEFHISLEGLKTANPAMKVEKTMIPKKGESEEDYKKRMR